MGCVPNKKLSVQPTSSSTKTSRVKFQQTPAPLPPSFAPDSYNQDQGLNSSQVGSNFLTASRIAGYDLEQQTKQNTYLNSLPRNQKLRTSNASITTTTPQSSMVPPLPPMSSQNIMPQERHQLPRMPTPFPQQQPVEHQQHQISFAQQNVQMNQQNFGQSQQLVTAPQFPTSPNIPLLDQTVAQQAQVKPFSQYRPTSQAPQIPEVRQIHQLSRSPPPHQMPQLPTIPQTAQNHQMQHMQQYQQGQQMAQIPLPQPASQPYQVPQIPNIPRAPSAFEAPQRHTQYSQSPSRGFQSPLPQFGQPKPQPQPQPQFQMPIINTRPPSTASTTSIQLPQQPRPVSPSITTVRQGMMPVNQDLLRQIMRQTHINDQGFKQIFVQKMDFGRVR